MKNQNLISQSKQGDYSESEYESEEDDEVDESIKLAMKLSRE